MGSHQGNSGKVKPNPIKARWTPELHEILIDLCIEQITIGNRPGAYYTKDGWKNIFDSFHTITGLKFDKVQVKNHLHIARTQWQAWHKLISTDMMKWDPDARRFGASDEEWNDYLERNPDAAPFRFKELPIVDKLDMVFGGTADSEETPRRPRRRKQSEYFASTQPYIRPRKLYNYSIRRQPATQGGWPAVEPVNVIPDGNAERCCDAVESRSVMTVQSPIPKLSYSIEDCIKCLDSIEEVEQGSELYLFALDVFLKQEYREIFLNLKKSSTRIAWLERLQSVGPPLHLNLDLEA